MSDSASDTPQKTNADEPTLKDDVSSLLKEVRSHMRRLTGAKNLLKDVAKKEPQAADFEKWLKVQQGLEGNDFGIAEIDELRQKVLTRLGPALQRLRLKARMTFTTKMEILAKEQELEVERISEAPLVLYLQPLTVEVDFDEGGARILYGHELIDELPIDAAQILAARHQALSQMQSQATDSETFFDLLRSAYAMALAAAGKEAGARVDLVDVLVPLAMLRASRKDLRKKGVDAIDAYPRHLLAWQLAQLRRDGMLERNGARLDLGAATGGSTRNKSDVLYIPVGATNGQYYVSLRFVLRA